MSSGTISGFYSRVSGVRFVHRRCFGFARLMLRLILSMQEAGF